jgi:hypothetical protein
VSERIKSVSLAANTWDETLMLNGEPIQSNHKYHFDSNSVFLDQLNEDNGRGYSQLLRIKWDDGSHTAGDVCCAYAGRTRKKERSIFVPDDAKDHRRSKAHKTRSKRIDCRFHQRISSELGESKSGVAITFTRTMIPTHNNHPRYLGPKIANLRQDVCEEAIQDSVAYGFSAPTMRAIIEDKGGGIVPDSALKSLQRRVKTRKIKQQLEQDLANWGKLNLIQVIEKQVTDSSCIALPLLPTICVP